MKILLTTIHPAPYIDKWIEVLEQNHKVDVLYVERKNAEKTWKDFTVKDPYYYDEFSLLKLLRFFKKYDFVLFGGWYVKQNILYSQLLKLSKTKTAFFSDHPEEKKISFFTKQLKKIIINSANYLFVTSESVKDYFLKNYNVSKNNVKIFPYAHNYDFEVQPNSDSGKIKIFIANRFIERKGHHIVLQSFEILKEKQLLDSFDITIAGGGELYEFYKDKYLALSDYIKIYEWIENDDYISYLKSSDIYLHASIFEPFGIPPLDAMQLGKIVIVSDGVKSLNTFLNRSKGLIIYSATNAYSLANILEEMTHRNFKGWGKQNSRIIKEYYSPQILLRAFQDL